MGKVITGAGFYLAMAICVAPVLAQIDPDPNGIGIYFDEGATVFCTEADLGSEIAAYLCLTRITSQTGISKWEATVEVFPRDAILAWSMRGQAVNASEVPEFVVELAGPLPWQSSLVVLEVTISVLAEYPLAFRVHPVENPSVTDTPFPLPAYAAGDDPADFRTLGYSWGWDPTTGTPNWCAVVNPVGDCSDPPTDNADHSWGEIKALYRQ